MLHLFSLVMLSVPVGASEADPAIGKNVFAACAACHAPDLPTRTGPDLQGVIGRKAGTQPGFRYSRAMQRAKLTWDEPTLDAFLADPQATVPGNTMPFPGVPDAAARRDLIAYLKTLK